MECLRVVFAFTMLLLASLPFVSAVCPDRSAAEVAVPAPPDDLGTALTSNLATDGEDRDEEDGTGDAFSSIVRYRPGVDPSTIAKPGAAGGPGKTTSSLLPRPTGPPSA